MIIKKNLPVIIIAVISLVLFFFIVKVVSKSLAATRSSGDNRVVVDKPKSVASLNKEFSYPLTDSKGKKVTEIKYGIDTAELRDQIIVQGKMATAIQGRSFLILNLRLVNTYSKALNINTKDYVRLTMNGKENDFIAPDIHNDPVGVEPASTKYTRLGWAINDSDKKLQLWIGEINGTKTKVELNFK